MKLMLFMFVSLAFAESTITVESYPETRYLFRDLNLNTHNATQIKDVELKTHAAIDEMHAEAKDLKLKTAPVAFTILDLEGIKVRRAGLEVAGNELKKVAPEKLKTRAAGKFLVFRYSGNMKDLSLKEVKAYLEKNNLKLSEQIAYQYKKSVIPRENNQSSFIFPLEAKK